MRRAPFLMLITAMTATAMVSLSAAQRASAQVQAQSRGPGWLPRAAAIQGRGNEALTPAERAVVEARFAEYERGSRVVGPAAGIHRSTRLCLAA